MSERESVRRELVSRLTLEGQHLIGCRRRGVWSQKAEQPWSFLSGNAVLRTLGNRRTAFTPAGPFDYLVYDGHLLLFRGGEFQSYWLEDARDAYALAKQYGHLAKDVVFLLVERRGELDVHEVDISQNLDYTTRAEEIVEEAQADPPGRISKATHRALRVCRYCPVKQRCDAQDKLRGEDDDWSTSYPTP